MTRKYNRARNIRRSTVRTHTNGLTHPMRPDLHERRQRTWELLYFEGRSRAEVTAELAAEFGVTEGTIREDIDSMAEWLPELTYEPNKFVRAASRLQELRKRRRRLHAMAQAAAEKDDLRLELDIHRELTRTLTLDEEMSDKVEWDMDQRRLDEGYVVDSSDSYVVIEEFE